LRDEKWTFLKQKYSIGTCIWKHKQNVGLVYMSSGRCKLCYKGLPFSQHKLTDQFSDVAAAQHKKLEFSVIDLLIKSIADHFFIQTNHNTTTYSLLIANHREITMLAKGLADHALNKSERDNHNDRACMIMTRTLTGAPRGAFHGVWQLGLGVFRCRLKHGVLQIGPVQPARNERARLHPQQASKQLHRRPTL
jgi:hypothetical protein